MALARTEHFSIVSYNVEMKYSLLLILMAAVLVTGAVFFIFQSLSSAKLFRCFFPGVSVYIRCPVSRCFTSCLRRDQISTVTFRHDDVYVSLSSCFLLSFCVEREAYAGGKPAGITGTTAPPIAGPPRSHRQMIRDT